MLGALNAHRGSYNLSNVNWFSLRDSNSSARSFQEQWGLMRDDYSPKPAFAAYGRLVERLSARTKPGLKVRAHAKGASGLAITGRLLLPGGVAPASGCRGPVRLVVRAGARTLLSHRLRLRPACTFAGRIPVSLPGRGTGMRASAYFGGNRALRATRSAPVRLSGRAGP